MDKYQVTYRGQWVEVRDMPGYVPRKDVSVIEGDFHGIAQRDIMQDGKVYHKKGDTLGSIPKTSTTRLNTGSQVARFLPSTHGFRSTPAWA